jgi:hypothetical protein
MAPLKEDALEQKLSSKFLLAIAATALAVTLPFLAARARPEGNSSIVGKVLDRTTGQPLAAEIGLVLRTPAGVTLKHLQAAADGSFALAALPAGDAHLSTRCDGYAVERQSLTLHETQTQQLEFQLVKIKKVRGMIFAETGAPLAAAHVKVVYANDAAPGALNAAYQWETGAARSDAQGQFELEVHPDREFLIEAAHPQFVSEVSQPLRLAPHQAEASVTLSLSKGVTVTGEARDTFGNAIAGARVRLNDEEERPELQRFTSFELLRQRTQQTSTNAEGAFRFEQVSPAQKTLLITHPQYQPSKQAVTLTKGQESFTIRPLLQHRKQH